MPQGDKFSSSGGDAGVGLPASDTYKRKVIKKRTGRGVIAAKSEGAATHIESNFLGALPRMTQTIETLIAAKLIANGSYLR